MNKLFNRTLSVFSFVCGMSALPGFAADEADTVNFLVGKYLVVGKALDSEETYLGKIEIRAENGGLKITRVIGDRQETGLAAIETAIGGEATVLRMRYTSRGAKIEETCLWQSDLDNYARISCYLYRPGVPTTQPGLEALFHDSAS